MVFRATITFENLKYLEYMNRLVVFPVTSVFGGVAFFGRNEILRVISIWKD